MEPKRRAGADALIMDNSGNLYGATDSGGYKQKSCHGYFGCGVIFKLASDATETVLYSFESMKSGGGANLGLAADKKGNLYGTTFQGGKNNCGSYTCGLVFKLVVNKQPGS